MLWFVADKLCKRWKCYIMLCYVIIPMSWNSESHCVGQRFFFWQQMMCMTQTNWKPILHQLPSIVAPRWLCILRECCPFPFDITIRRTGHSVLDSSQTAVWQSKLVQTTNGATTLSPVNCSGYVGHATIFRWMFTISCCLVVAKRLPLCCVVLLLLLFFARLTVVAFISLLPIPREAIGSYAENQRISAVRKVYQRGVVNPMLNIEQLWKEYCAFEHVRIARLSFCLIRNVCRF